MKSTKPGKRLGVSNETWRRWRYKVLFDWRMESVFRKITNRRHQKHGMSIRLEACSVCQLKCPACSTATGKNKRNVIGWGMLKLKDFKALLDDNPQIHQIELSNWGEIFLNPYLKDMMAYAHEKGVRLQAANGANLNNVKDATLEALVKYRFERITVSLDGASHDTYKQYRVKGSFKRVIRHIERINYFKRKYNSKYPKLTWQFVVFGHNEHELPAAREMAESLGMTFKPKFNHTPTFSPVKDKSFVREQTGHKAASRKEFVNNNGRYKRACAQLWETPQINWDGEMLGCCVNKWDSFGNVFEDGLEAVMNNERYRYAQRMVLGLEPDREDIPCSKCKVYQRQVLQTAQFDEDVTIKRWKKFDGDEKFPEPTSQS